jgi:hypothetical protein
LKEDGLQTPIVACDKMALRQYAAHYMPAGSRKKLIFANLASGG